jgi:hypothetical protein
VIANSPRAWESLKFNGTTINLTKPNHAQELLKTMRTERLVLLKKITALASAVKYSVFVEYTLERAMHFYNSYLSKEREKAFPKELAKHVKNWEEVDRIISRISALLPLEMLKDEQAESYVWTGAKVIFITTEQLLK